MGGTLEERLKFNYEMAINEGKNIYVKVDTVLLKGIPVADKLTGLSMTQKKNLGFNPTQIRTIESRCSLNKLDISLLHVIQRAFGGLGTCHLTDLLKDFKNLRNDFVHEQQTLLLTKKELRSRLATLKVLYRAILEELKKYCDPSEIPLLNIEIADMDARLVLLEKTIDDHIQEKTVASAKATKQMIQSSAKLDQEITKATGTLAQSVSQTSVNLDATINQARDDLIQTVDTIKQNTSDIDQNLKQTVLNLSQQTNDSVEAMKSVNQAMKNFTQQLSQLSINKDDLKRKMMLQQSVDTVKKAIRIFGSMENDLEEIIDELSKVQTGLRGTKWTTAAVWLRTFTVAAAVITDLIGSGTAVRSSAGAAGGGTAVIDFAWNDVAQNTIKEYSLEAKKHLEETKMVLENVLKMDAIAANSETAAAALPLLVRVLGVVGVALTVVDAVSSQVKESTSIEAVRNMQVQIKDSIIDLNKQVVVLESTL